MKRNGQPTRREIELAAARAAGYENDRKAFTRALIERRAASYTAMHEEFRRGEAMRQATA